MRNVPVIMQMETVECGAVSLAMILASYGRWVSMDEIRYACGVSRSGTSAADLMKAGQNYGLEVKGMRLGIEQLHSLREPCVMHVDMAHFIVFRGFIGKFAMANDPAKGLIYLSMEELSRRFSGIVLTFRPTSAFRKAGSRTTLLHFIRKRLKGAGEQFVFKFLIALLLATVSVSLPIATQAFTDGVLSGKNPGWGEPIIITLSLLALFQLAVNCLSASYGMKLNAKTQIYASSSFLWHILRLPVPFFSSRMPGDILMRIGNAGNIPITLTTKIAPLAVNLSLLLLYGFFMYRYSVLLSTIVVAATVIVIISVYILSFFQMNLTRKAEYAEGKLQSNVMSNIDSIETIKSAGAEGGAFIQWASLFTSSSNANISINKFTEYVNLIPNLLIQIAGILVLITGSKIILDGDITIGMLMAFQGFTTSFTTPMTDILGVAMTLSGMRSKMERVEDVYLARTDVESVTIGNADMKFRDKLKGDVEMRNVTFGYSSIHEPLIRDFSCHLEPGKSIAFVGASGSGKSTLANILSGIYKPWTGDVLFDGKTIGEIGRAVFTSSVAMVSQTNSFFSGILSDNLKVWDDSISDETLMNACKYAMIHDEIIVRRGKYECNLDSGGTNFSGGQCQRMELASALATNPSVLILDEATSALDARTEAEIMKSVRSLNISLVIIAHRLSTIRDCDEIIVLDRGVVVERGTHETLKKLDGFYSKLINDNG